MFETLPWLLLVVVVVPRIRGRCKASKASELLRQWPFGSFLWLWERLVQLLGAASLVGHYFCTRCPIYCCHCRGDFYHELNAGIPYESRCHAGDIIASMVSLGLGLLATFLGVLFRLFASSPQPRWKDPYESVWICSTAVALRRAVLATILGYGLMPSLWQDAVANCKANPPRQGTRPSIAVAASWDYMWGYTDHLECTQNALKTYTGLHGYPIIQVSNKCQKLWDKYNKTLGLPAMSNYVRDRLAAGKFDTVCKLLALQIIMHENPEVEWFWWIDADALVTNFDVKLEEFLPDEDIDMVVTMGSGDGGWLHLPPGMWGSIFSYVPSWSSMPGHFNSGSFLFRNTPFIKSTFRDAMNFKMANSGTMQDLDQWSIFASLRKSYGLEGERLPDPGEFALHGDVLKHEVCSMRVLNPRCLNVHPMSWAPWNRWQPGDFITHSWGRFKRKELLHFCPEQAAQAAEKNELPIKSTDDVWWMTGWISFIVFSVLIAVVVLRVLCVRCCCWRRCGQRGGGRGGEEEAGGGGGGGGAKDERAAV